MRPMNKENLCVKSYHLKVKTHVQKAITRKTYAYNLRILSMRLPCGVLVFDFWILYLKTKLGRCTQQLRLTPFRHSLKA